jgi:hypothetical protein
MLTNINLNLRSPLKTYNFYSKIFNHGLWRVERPASRVEGKGLLCCSEWQVTGSELKASCPSAQFDSLVPTP